MIGDIIEKHAKGDQEEAEKMVNLIVDMIAETGDVKFKVLQKLSILFDKIHKEALNTFAKNKNENGFKEMNSLLDQFIKLVDDCIERNS